MQAIPLKLYKPSPVQSGWPFVGFPAVLNQLRTRCILRQPLRKQSIHNLFIGSLPSRPHKAQGRKNADAAKADQNTGNKPIRDIRQPNFMFSRL